jgi:hypothetical protein
VLLLLIGLALVMWSTLKAPAPCSNRVWHCTVVLWRKGPARSN